eukprot:3268968-Rhodomonas_salina.2
MPGTVLAYQVFYRAICLRTCYVICLRTCCALCLRKCYAICLRTCDGKPGTNFVYHYNQVSSAIGLRACYAMSGTGLIVCYAVSGTDRAYHDTPLSPYVSAMRNPVLTWLLFRYQPTNLLCDVRY